MEDTKNRRLSCPTKRSTAPRAIPRSANYTNMLPLVLIASVAALAAGSFAMHTNTVNELAKRLEATTAVVVGLEARIEALEAAPAVQKVEAEPAPAVEVAAPAKKAATKPAQQSGKYKITFYCSCKKCCGKTDGITASGTKATANRTVAAPKSFPFGTQLQIEGLGYYVVEDRGGSIKGNRIDVYVDSHEEALKLGVKYANVEVARD